MGNKRQYGLVAEIGLNTRLKGAHSVTLTAQIGEYFVPFVHHGPSKKIYLPVAIGAGFSLRASNHALLQSALPARIGDGTTWTNICRECPEVDPSLMPVHGGMWVLDPGMTHTFDGFSMRSGEHEPFVVEPEHLGPGGSRSIIEFYRREWIDRNGMCGDDQTRKRPSASHLPAADLGGCGEPQCECAELTFAPKATLIARIHLVAREEMAGLLAADGIRLDGNTDLSWKFPHYRYDHADDPLRLFLHVAAE